MNQTICLEDWRRYFSLVLKDFQELKERYPFSTLYLPPTVDPQTVTIFTIAVDKEIVEMTNGRPDDFKGQYTKELFIEVPIDYNTKGCRVFGCPWFDKTRFQDKDIHIYHDKNRKKIESNYGYQLCVGTPESFQNLGNVILEAVRTAEFILVAYERVQIGESNEVELNAYSHGEKGREEYKRARKREAKHGKGAS